MRKGANGGHPQVDFAADAYHFMDFALDEDELRFQVIGEKGERIHAATLPKRDWKRSAGGLWVAA
ncbi:MAG: hypothetical protein R2748_18120 [Bryobacterales bacterium]